MTPSQQGSQGSVSVAASVQQPFTNLITQPNASPEPASPSANVQMLSPSNPAAASILNQSTGPVALSQSTGAVVEVSVSFPSNVSHDPVTSFSATNVEYTSTTLNFSDFMNVEAAADRFKKKEDYPKNSSFGSSMETGGLNMSSSKNYSSADMGGYASVSAVDYMDANRNDSNVTGTVLEYNQAHVSTLSISLIILYLVR